VLLSSGTLAGVATQMASSHGVITNTASLHGFVTNMASLRGFVTHIGVVTNMTLLHGVVTLCVRVVPAAFRPTLAVAAPMPESRGGSRHSLHT
jgi:hypothetical protein